MGALLNYRLKIAEKLTIVATEMSSWILSDRDWNYKLSDFKLMPPNSLGRRYYEYMSLNKISYKPNLIRHDIKHILLSYEMKMPDEMRLHTYLMGNRSFNFLGTIYLAVCLILVPEQLAVIKSDYRKGKLSKRLKGIDLRPYLMLDLNYCRRQLNIII